MRKVLTVARREYIAAVRSKGFIIGLVLAPILMSGGFIGMAVFKGHVDTRDQRLAVVDRSGKVAQALVEAAKARNEREVTDPKSGKKVKPAYLIELVAPDDANPEAQRLHLSDRVRDQSLHAFLEISADLLKPRPEPGAPNSVLREEWRARRLAAVGRFAHQRRIAPLATRRRWRGYGRADEPVRLGARRQHGFGDGGPPDRPGKES